MFTVEHLKTKCRFGLGKVRVRCPQGHSGLRRDFDRMSEDRKEVRASWTELQDTEAKDWDPFPQFNGWGNHVLRCFIPHSQGC